MDEQCGIDASFTCEVPDYLKCVVCTLVLKEPLQISKCGHKFCSPCFNKLKSYPRDQSTPLLCPIDRKVIDLNTVFEDTSTAMIIRSLPVKCPHDQCPWTGDLSDLDAHEMKCEFKNSSQLAGDQIADVASFMKVMMDRMTSCEAAVHEKDKDLAHFKFNLQELRSEFDEKMVENQLLVDRNKAMEEALRLQGGQGNGVKQFEMKLENLTLKNIILEQKLESTESKLLRSKQMFEEETHALKDEIKELRGCSENILSLKEDVGELSVWAEHIPNLKQMVCELRENGEEMKQQLSTEINEVRESGKNDSVLQAEVEKCTLISENVQKLDAEVYEIRDACKELPKLKSDVHEINTSLQKRMDDISALKKLQGETKACQQNNSNELKKFKALKLNYEIQKLKTLIDGFKDALYEQKLDDLESRFEEFLVGRISPLEDAVTNLELLSFCHYTSQCNDLVLMWRVQNFKECFEAGTVTSPLFGARLGGYLMQLVVSSHNRTGHLGIALKLHRGQARLDQDLVDFSVPYTLEIQSKDGHKKSQTVTTDMINENRPAFTIKAGDDCMEKNYGFPQMVCESDIQNYVINDSILITCILKC